MSLKTEVDAAGIARLTINREAQRNALSVDVVASMLRELDRLEADAQVRCIVLTGAGERVFCAGGDLGGLADGGLLASHEGRKNYGRLLLRLQGFKKPTLARVNGHALAGGLGLVLACDLAVAVDTAGFGLPEVDRGLFPMMVIALLQRHLGRKQALEMVLTGERITAAYAQQLGLLNRVVPLAELDAATQVLASQLASKSQAVVALGKRAFISAEGLPLENALELLAANLSLNVLLEDAAEGVSAFLEKRQPRWSDR